MDLNYFFFFFFSFKSVRPLCDISWLLVWPILLVLFLEFFHVGGQKFSILQGNSIVQRCTNSSNWPAGGDKPSCLRSITRLNCWSLYLPLHNLTRATAQDPVLSISNSWHIVMKEPLMQQQEACVCQSLTCVLSVRSFHVWMHLPEISSPSLHLRLSSPHETVRSCGFDKPRLQDTWTGGHSGK